MAVFHVFWAVFTPFTVFMVLLFHVFSGSFHVFWRIFHVFWGQFWPFKVILARIMVCYQFSSRLFGAVPPATTPPSPTPGQPGSRHFGWDGPHPDLSRAGGCGGQSPPRMSNKARCRIITAREKSGPAGPGPSM